MILLPIVARELRSAARRRSTYLGRVGAAFVPIAVAGFWLPVLASQFTTTQGKQLFDVLSALTFAYCLLAGARVTADCLSAEKREGTIGFLFLTDLKGYDVVLGKLVSSSVTGFYALLGIVPVLSLALLLGGVTLGEVGRVALLFANTLFFSLASGVLVSSLSRDDRRAMFATGCVILLVTGAPYLLLFGYNQSPWAGTTQGAALLSKLSRLMSVSPAFAFETVRSFSPASRVGLKLFYDSILVTHLLSWIFLAVASGIIPRMCRERPPGKWGARWLVWRNRWSYGAPEQRAAFRARLLDRNAFYWLAARDRIKAHYVWFFVAAFALIWCWSGWLLASFIFDWDISFILLFSLFLFFKLWLASEVCTRLVEDRASGAFELLLSSPLDLKDVARGQSLALWRQFGRPTLAVLLLTYLLLQSALRSPHYGVSNAEIDLLFAGLALMLGSDLITLKWVGSWQAITSNQANRAILGTCGRVLLLPTVLFLVLYSLLAILQQVFSPNQGEERWIRGQVCLLWLSIGLLNNLYFGLRARWRFLHQFREIATQRYAPPVGLEPFLALVRGMGSRLAPRGRTPALVVAGLKWKRWLLAPPLLLGLMVWIGLSIHKDSVDGQVNKRLTALKAAGQPATLAELDAFGPVPPEQQNAAVLLQKAVPFLCGSSQMRRSKTNTWKAEWPGPSAPLSPEQAENIDALLKRNVKALDLLQAAARLPQSRFQISWRNFGIVPPSSVPWQTLAPLSPAGEVLQFQALRECDRGDTLQAVSALETLLGLSRALGQEPYLAAQHYRVDSLIRATRILERILNHCPLSLEAGLRLSQRLHEEELGTGPALARAFVSERCLTIDAFRSPPVVMVWGPSASGLQKAIQDAVNYGREVLGFREQDLLGSLDMFEDLLIRARQIGAPVEPPPQTTLQASQGLTGARRQAPAAGWQELFDFELEAIGCLRLAQTALAVERFRSAHAGERPDQLATLAPELLGLVPSDPFAAAPLHYKKLEQGYILYSVGKDGQDDGGKANPSLYSSQHRSGFDVCFQVLR